MQRPIDGNRGLINSSFVQRGLTRVSASVAIAIAVSACGSTPIGYDRIEDSNRYVTPETLAAIEKQRLVRDEVIAVLGAPDADMPEFRALGFLRCTEPSGKELQILFPLVWPFSGEEYKNRHCQRIGVWFDMTGRAFRTASKAKVEGTENCTLSSWLRKPGGSRGC